MLASEKPSALASTRIPKHRPGEVHFWLMPLASCRACRRLVVIIEPVGPGDWDAPTWNPDPEERLSILSRVGIETVADQGFGPKNCPHRSNCPRGGG